MPRPAPVAFAKRLVYATERRDSKVTSLSVWGLVLSTYTLAIHDFSQPIVAALVSNGSSSLIGVLSASIVFGGNYKYARTLVSEVTHASPTEVDIRVHNLLGTKSSDVQRFLLKDFKFANEDNKQILFHVTGRGKDGKPLPEQRLFLRKNGEVEHFILDAIRPPEPKPVSRPTVPKRKDIRVHHKATM